MGGIFAIGDLHLPEEIQICKHGYPEDYFNRLKIHLTKFQPEVLLIAGDLIWEYDLDRFVELSERIKELPGKIKLFIEGNHDPWFDQLGSDYEDCQSNAARIFNTLDFYYIGGRATIFRLENGIDVGICGTRGYLTNRADKEQPEDHFNRITQIDALSRSLATLSDLINFRSTKLNICLLHYPPTYHFFTNRRVGNEAIFDRIRQSTLINSVVFGHVHKDEHIKIYQKIAGIQLFFVPIERIGYTALRIPDS